MVRRIKLIYWDKQRIENVAEENGMSRTKWKSRRTDVWTQWKPYLRKAKRKLVPKQYIVLVMLLHGMKQIDIAKKLNISQPAVSKRKGRAIRNLRKKFNWFQPTTS